jgi:hypothetical protein
VLLRHHGIAQLIGLVIVLDDRTGELGALRDAEPLGQRAGGDVADDHLDRNDLDLTHQLLAHVKAPHEVGRHADLAQLGHQEFGDPVVQDPLARDGATLLVIEGGRIVLEILHQSARLRPFEEDLGLALVDPPASCHGGLPKWPWIGLVDSRSG